MSLTPHIEQPRYKIFISYRRRSASVHFMQRVVSGLHKRMPNVEFFIDFINMDSTSFGDSIRKHLAQSDCFLLMLTADTLDPERLSRSDDWIRYEVCLALKQGLPLIQVSDGTPFAVADKLPQNIRELANRHGITMNYEHWRSSLRRLVDFIPHAVSNRPAPVQTECSFTQVLLPAEVKPAEPEISLEDTAVHAGVAMRVLGKHTDWVRSVAWSPNGKYLASGSHDKTVCLWDVARKQLVETLHEHTDWIRSVAWSHDSKYVASGSDDRTVCLWNAANGLLLSRFTGHTGWVHSVAWSPEGKYLASAATDQTICLWDVRSRQLWRTLQTKTYSVCLSLAWSPSGQYLATGSNDRIVRLWNVKTGQIKKELSGHAGWIDSIAWSPDGRYLASASTDQTIHIWDVNNGQLVRAFNGHRDWVRCVAWSPDGRYLASGSKDKTIRLWEIASGHRIRTLEGHTGWVSSVAWSPDGRRLASSSSDNTIIIWGISE